MQTGPPNVRKSSQNCPFHIPTLFPDSVIKQAKKDIASFDKGRSGSVYKKGHYHPYERPESKPDNRKQDRPAWKNLSRGHNKRNKGKHQYSSRPAKGQQAYDNYCINMLQERMLAWSPSVPEQTMNFVNLNVNCHVAKPVHTAPGLSQKKEISPRLADCYLKEHKLKYVKSASCITQLSCVKPVTNVKNVASNLPVGVRLQNFW